MKAFLVRHYVNTYSRVVSRLAWMFRPMPDRHDDDWFDMQLPGVSAKERRHPPMFVPTVLANDYIDSGPNVVHPLLCSVYFDETAQRWRCATCEAVRKNEDVRD